jgi:hypothetical protein
VVITPDNHQIYLEFVNRPYRSNPSEEDTLTPRLSLALGLLLTACLIPWMYVGAVYLPPTIGMTLCVAIMVAAGTFCVNAYTAGALAVTILSQPLPRWLHQYIAYRAVQLAGIGIVAIGIGLFRAVQDAAQVLNSSVLNQLAYGPQLATTVALSGAMAVMSVLGLLMVLEGLLTVCVERDEAWFGASIVTDARN